MATQPTSDKRSIVDTWQSRETTGLDRAERHSRFVFIMRLILPILAVGIVMVVVIYSVAYKPNIQRIFEYPAGQTGSGRVSMVNPKLTGLDIEDRYFTVTAKEAVRQADAPDDIVLRLLDVEISKDGAELLKLHAARGTAHTKTNQMVFGPLVQIDLPQGYSFQTDSTLVDMDKAIIRGDDPIHGEGPVGKISANRYEITKDEGIVILSGNVRLSVDPKVLKDTSETTVPVPQEETKEERKPQG